MEKRTVSKQARIGKIAFVNTIPFYFNLFPSPLPSPQGRGDSGRTYSSFPSPQGRGRGEGDGFIIREGTPVEINKLMSEGELDFAPVSSLEYALHQDQYLLLPNLCIGSRDFSRSVLLLSRERIEGLKNKKMMLSKKSLSSAALLKILFKFKYRFSNEYSIGNGSPGDMLEKADAVLAIGDDALFFKPTEFLYKYDLSELWWNWTDLPFCFSLWVVRRDFYRKNPREVFDFQKRLIQNIERNLLDLETLLKEALGLTVADPNFSRVFGYLFNLNYYLDRDMKEGLELFYGFAHRAGLSPSVSKLEFIEA